MKKLTKKSLDELANSMSIISDAEQMCYNGGTYVYNSAGTYLGYRGTGSDVVIASSLYATQFDSISVADDQTILNVLNTIARGIGLTHANDNRFAEMDSTTGKISINAYSELLSSNNYYDYLSILQHEKYHQMTIGYSTTWEQNEYQAFIHQINDSSFQNVSVFLRDYTIDNYNNLHNSQSYY